MDLPRIAWLLPIALVLAALAPLPYGYYVFLRIVLCGACALLAFSDYRRKQSNNLWLVGLLLLAVIYNPLIPVHLEREVWAPINVATAGFLFLHMLRRPRVA